MRSPTHCFVFCFTLTLCSLSNAARLGDIRDKQPKDERAKKNQAGDEAYTPEEKKQLVTELSDDYYKKGVAALRQDQLSEAKAYFEKVLALSPNHSRAREHMSTIKKMSAEKRKTMNPQPPATPSIPIEEKPSPVKKATSQKILSPEMVRKKTELDKQGSDELYYQALAASQNKEKVQALDLCRQALKLNPSNLQAQRMLDRLSQ